MAFLKVDEATAKLAEAKADYFPSIANRYIVRSYMPNKDSTVVGSWALRTQVIHDRLTRLLGQWKNVAATQLTHREMDSFLFPSPCHPTATGQPRMHAGQGR